MKRLLLLLLSLQLFLVNVFWAQESLHLTYVGNMGVLIHNEQSAVLIDGLHKEYGPDYLFPPAPLTDQLINGQSGVPPIALILHTHRHGDHFDAALCARFLKKNPAAAFIGSQQAADLIAKVANDLSHQVKAIPYDNYQKHFFTFDGFTLKAFKMNHVSPVRHKAIQNLGFIVEISGQKILHIGDSHWYEDLQLFEQLKMIDENIDIAILPYWMLFSDKSKSNLKQYINPRYLIATHIPPNLSEKDAQAIYNRFPDVVLFRNLEQTFSPGGN